MTVAAASAQARPAEARGIAHGERYDRLVIRNVMVIDGKGTPTRGPHGRRRRREQDRGGPRRRRPAGRLQERSPRPRRHRACTSCPASSTATSISTTSGPGSPSRSSTNTRSTSPAASPPCGTSGAIRRKPWPSAARARMGAIVAPRIYVYMVAGGRTPEEGRTVGPVDQGAGRRRRQDLRDGPRHHGGRRRRSDQARPQGRPPHGRRGDRTPARRPSSAWTRIEHWYGIPDAALKGSQNFPPSYNFNNESDRFRWAGRLWREADPDKLEDVLDEMVEKGVGWIPTFSTYEACRDMTRARNLPWFKDYLHPALEAYFEPSPERHGAFSWGWSTEDEIAWKENYRIWMKAVRDFADRGGVVGRGGRRGFHLHALRLHLPERARAPAGGGIPSHRCHPVRDRQQRQADGARGPARARAPGLPGRPHPRRREPAGQPQVSLPDRGAGHQGREAGRHAAASSGRSRTDGSTRRRGSCARSGSWSRRPGPK
ncbi:MAG: hypothetical protein M0C28_01450 [Candidatus Moduliflexus flocculans]|nr:hypothetical protein [Candidatus Moduliflexus flocculans]